MRYDDPERGRETLPERGRQQSLSLLDVYGTHLFQHQEMQMRDATAAMGGQAPADSTRRPGTFAYHGDPTDATASSQGLLGSWLS